MRPRIREFRKQQGRTQQEVAEAVGCHRSAMSEWETGTRRVPQWHLWTLARYFHVTVDELYDFDDTDAATPANGTTSDPGPLPPPPTPRAAPVSQHGAGLHALPPRRRRASRAPH
jgi:DNA-binding XRE family transcriptional regulator